MPDHSRRRFLEGGLALLVALLTALAGCGVPAPWETRQARVARIGYLGGSIAEVVAPLLEAFRNEMRRRGYVEGRNFALDLTSPRAGRTDCPHSRPGWSPRART
jgi:hypothetical protein